MNGHETRAISFEGHHVRLETLNQQHEPGIFAAISDGELWSLFVTLVPPIYQVGRFIDDARAAHEAGDGLAFSTIDKTSNRVVGSTRFMNAEPAHRRIGIGYDLMPPNSPERG